MSTCKHDWHFVGETTSLKCQRCGQVVGPWTTEQLSVPADKLPLSFANLKPDYNVSFHSSTDTFGTGKMVGKLDFNGPEMVFTGDAGESAKVFIDWIATAFKGRLEAERQAELDACCDLLEGMHAATTGSHNYYLHAAVELRRLRKGENNGQR